MCERNVAAFQLFDVTHHFGFAVIFIEYIISQILRFALKTFVERLKAIHIFHISKYRAVSGCFSKNLNQSVQIFDVSCFVNAQTNFSAFEIAEVYFVCKCCSAEFIQRNFFGKRNFQRIEKVFVFLRITIHRQNFVQISSNGMNASGNIFNPISTVIYSVHTGH